jgi:hypothetical protein
LLSSCWLYIIAGADFFWLWTNNFPSIFSKCALTARANCIVFCSVLLLSVVCCYVDVTECGCVLIRAMYSCALLHKACSRPEN